MTDAQRRLGVRVTDHMNEETRLALRAFQLEQGLLVDGRLTEETYSRLHEARLLGR